MARAQVLKSFTLKFQQSNKYLRGNKRGRTRKNSTNESQDLDPKGSPHKEEKVIGGVVDLDLHSLFPKLAKWPAHMCGQHLVRLLLWFFNFHTWKNPSRYLGFSNYSTNIVSIQKNIINISCTISNNHLARNLHRLDPKINVINIVSGFTLAIFLNIKCTNLVLKYIS